MKKTLSILAAILISGTTLSAQTVSSGYFLDNYSFGYRNNPSIMIEKSFFGLGISSLTGDVNSDLGLTSFVFPNAAGDGLVTALHPSVKASDFMARLKDVNNFNFDYSHNLFAVGSRKDNSMLTFEVNLVNEFNVGVPKGLFAFIKEGSSSSAFDFSGFGFADNLMVEFALGKANILRDGKLIVGGRVKVLVGGATAYAKLDKASLTVNGDKVSAEVSAVANMSCEAIEYGTDAGNVDLNNVTLKTQGISPAGLGLALDLGLTWKPTNFLTLTAGVNDLGAMMWKNLLVAKTEGVVSFEGLENIDFNSAESSATEELDNLKEDLLKIADFKFTEGTGNTFNMRPMTVNAGAKVNIPGTNVLSAGVLGTYRFASTGSSYELRAGATFTPLRFISLSGNYGVTSYGPVCGAAASVTLLGINVYAAVDSYAGPVTILTVSDVAGLPIPINPFRYRFSLGLNLQFGQRR